MLIWMFIIFGQWSFNYLTVILYINFWFIHYWWCFMAEIWLPEISLRLSEIIIIFIRFKLLYYHHSRPILDCCLPPTWNLSSRLLLRQIRNASRLSALHSWPLMRLVFYLTCCVHSRHNLTLHTQNILWHLPCRILLRWCNCDPQKLR